MDWNLRFAAGPARLGTDEQASVKPGANVRHILLHAARIGRQDHVDEEPHGADRQEDFSGPVLTIDEPRQRRDREGQSRRNHARVGAQMVEDTADHARSFAGYARPIKLSSVKPGAS